MPYRFKERMSEIRYFDIIDDLIMKFIHEHLNTPCETCPDKDPTSVLCDECSMNKYNNGKLSYKDEKETK